MDNIENFFQNNKEQFDVLQPEANIWEKLKEKMNVPKKANSNKTRLWLLLAIFGLLVAAFIYYLSIPKTTMPLANSFPLEKGMVFPDIKLRSPNGKLVSLSSLKGKVVLLEFWASYSRVCTEENCYYFKPIYEEFKDKGFEIYAVSVDSSANSWIKAIEKDKLPWIQVSDLQGDQSALAKKLNIKKLPAIFLLNEKGEILEVEVDTKTLRDKLHKLLAYDE